MRPRPRLDRARTLLQSAPAFVPVVGEIDEANGAAIRRAISENSARPGGIRLMIHSEGGLFSVAKDIARDLRQLDVPVTARVASQCHSAAVLPLLAASHRSAGRCASFYLHRSSISFDELMAGEINAPRLRGIIADLEEIDREYMALVSELTMLPERVKQAALRTGCYLSAHEAYFFGLLDEVTAAP